MSFAERARAWLRKTWPWSLDADGPSEREVGLLAAAFVEVAEECRLVPTRSVATGGGDVEEVCEGCDHARSEPHTWKDCTLSLREHVNSLTDMLMMDSAGAALFAVLPDLDRCDECGGTALWHSKSHTYRRCDGKGCQNVPGGRDPRRLPVRGGASGLEARSMSPRKPSPSAIAVSAPLATVPLSADRLAVCNVCGKAAQDLETWRAHDERDKPIFGVRALVFLGAGHTDCYAKLQAHPRQFAQEDPRPGYVPHLCGACMWRTGLECKNPDAKANGGAGIRLELSSMGIVCHGRGRGGCRPLLTIIACNGRRVKEGAP